MAKIIGVRFRNNGKIYFFDSGRYIIKEGSGVIVETSQGVEFAEVVQSTREAAESEIVAPLKQIIRIATPKDVKQAEENREKEREALEYANRMILEHKLDMKLVRVEYTFDGAKIVFYFTSDGRVDFRDLVKDLASNFKTRIELRQIGARDEAKMLGGLGPCGLPCCCNQFLPDFQPVSIKMAKEQGLSLNPTKISGLCGRLMCCLKYEQHHYEQTRKLLPKVGTDVRCRDGVGKVCELNMLRERVKVKLTLPGDAVDIREYYYKELTVLDGKTEIPPVADEPEVSSDLLPGESIARFNNPPKEQDKKDKPQDKKDKPQDKKDKNKPQSKDASRERVEKPRKKSLDEVLQDKQAPAPPKKNKKHHKHKPNGNGGNAQEQKQSAVKPNPNPQSPAGDKPNKKRNKRRYHKPSGQNKANPSPSAENK